jgi:hypothetical protein
MQLDHGEPAPKGPPSTVMPAITQLWMNLN